MTPVLRLFPPALAIVVSLAATACVDLASAVGDRYVDKEEKRLAVTGKPDVNLTTYDGSIEVRGWDRPEVLVIIEKYGIDKEATSRIKVTIGQQDNKVTVDVTEPDRIGGVLHWHDTTHVKLIVSVPAASNIVARSGDGSLDISRVAGVLDLRSGDGSIRGHDVSGSLRARTGDGSISLDAVDGTADVDTGDGSVRLEGQLTIVRVKTGDGSVAVRAAPGSKADEDWDIRTGDGSVRLELADGFGGDLDAHTNDGRIHLDGVEVSNVTGEMGRGSLRGKLGAGGRAVRIRSGDGSISLRRY